MYVVYPISLTMKYIYLHKNASFIKMQEAQFKALEINLDSNYATLLLVVFHSMTKCFINKNLKKGVFLMKKISAHTSPRSNISPDLDSVKVSTLVLLQKKIKLI